ncbi:MAG: hypothetical protein HY261_00545, partial [Chloroflexi bacterium]|nr:hypothetical protein [Chloroflexota bacterium]
MARTVFTNANLLDGDHAARKGVTVVVDGEHIVEVASSARGSTGSPRTARAGDRVVDLKGKTVMPGMVLCHFHAGYENVGTFGGPIDLQYSPTYLAMIAARNATLCIMHGYTGAVGAGVGHNIDSTLKDAIANGLVEGPRLIAAGRDLVTSGDLVGAAPHWWKVGLDGVGRVCSGA